MIMGLCKIEIEKQKRQSQKEHQDLHGSAIDLHPWAASRRKFQQQNKEIKKLEQRQYHKPKPQYSQRGLSP